MDVDVIEINHLLKIYYAGKEIALHSLCENAKGEHVTDKSHYPSNKTITQEELLSRYREKMSAVGEGALAFLEAFRQTEMYQCHHYRSISGSSPFSGVSSLFTGVSDIFTSLFRRASLFPGVSPKLLIILVSTRFFSSSSLFSGVPDSCHQIFLKLHQLSLKLPITFFPC